MVKFASYDDLLKLIDKLEDLRLHEAMEHRDWSIAIGWLPSTPSDGIGGFANSVWENQFSVTDEDNLHVVHHDRSWTWKDGQWHDDKTGSAYPREPMTRPRH